MMHRGRVFLAFLLLLAATGAARADRVDEYLKAEMARQHIPGLSLAVVREGRIIKAEGYGLANVELNVPARPETVYKIASVSKQFIAAGIMLLVQDGKIRLDEHIVPLAWDAGVACEGVMLHTQEFTKTSHIWGVKNNSAGTNTNRIVIFRKPGPQKKR